jgi:MFS family permease
MSNVQVSNEAIAPNAKRLLWAGFMAILASGVGFSIRAGILADWGSQFGFTAGELGTITGGGLTGFGIVILLGGMLADKLGYGKLVILAFILHILSAIVTFAATPAYGAGGEAGKHAAYICLFWGTFIFAIANGTLEAVVNPMVATLFPNNRTHYLNLLHAGWPGGLILGGIAAAVMGTTPEHQGVRWEVQLSLFLIPAVAYGLMCLGQRFPKSEASQKGLKLSDMMKDIGLLGALVVCALLGLFFKNDLHLSPLVAFGIAFILWLTVGGFTKWSTGAWLLAVLLLAHLLVGSVELGTDSWISNITGNILNPSIGKWLFVYTSLIMFSLRFCADFIERKIGLSPVGILLTCATLSCIGLLLVARANTTAMVMIALFVYGVGKTFFWPTMLAVASDRFPRTGAVAISAMGGVGMLAAGLIGAPGLGYAKDRFASEQLQNANPGLYAQFKAETPSKFLIFKEAHGLDGKKLGEVKQTAVDQRTPDQVAVAQADMKGDRKTLVADAFIPALMAGIYLILFIYFKSIGGYKPVHIVPLAVQERQAQAKA